MQNDKAHKLIPKLQVGDTVHIVYELSYNLQPTKENKGFITFVSSHNEYIGVWYHNAIWAIVFDEGSEQVYPSRVVLFEKYYNFKRELEIKEIEKKLNGFVYNGFCV